MKAIQQWSSIKVKYRQIITADLHILIKYFKINFFSEIGSTNHRQTNTDSTECRLSGLHHRNEIYLNYLYAYSSFAYIQSIKKITILTDV